MIYKIAQSANDQESIDTLESIGALLTMMQKMQVGYFGLLKNRKEKIQSGRLIHGGN
jgi:hypothetical protein